MKNKKIKNNQRGITLIALVITIIVLIILAGVAISMLSGDNGILRQAAEAKEQTEEQSELEQVKLAAMSSMMNPEHKIQDLQGAIDNQFGANKATATEANGIHVVTVDSSGNRYEITEDGEAYKATWYYDGNGNVTNGTIKIALGDTINYDATNGGALSDDEYYYTSDQERNGNDDQTYKVSAASGLTWKVLGVEKGQILIMPTTNLATGGKNNNGYFYLGTSSSTDFTNSQNAYLNAVNELDSISAVYGHGKGADGARSVKVEDVDNIMTGFDKTTYNQNSINGYGHEVTYSKEEDGYIYYDWSGAATHPTKGRYQNFTYWTGSEWKTLGVGESVTLTSNYYSYSASTYKATSPKANDNVYSLLFDGTDDGQYYWLGSSYVTTDSGSAFFGVRYVNSSFVDGIGLFFSLGDANSGDRGVRPAVYLKSDINLKLSGTNAWNIN